MKKLLLSLIVIAGMAIMISSCSKGDVTPPNNGGTNPDPTPPAPAAPWLSVSLTMDNAPLVTDTVWYESNITCNFSSNGVVKYNGSDEVSNPIIFSKVKTPVTINLTSTITDPVTGKVSPVTPWSKTLQVYTANKTGVLKDISWKREVTLRSNDLNSPTETPVFFNPIQTVTDGWIFKFNLNNTYDLTIPGVGYWPNGKSYKFENGDTKIVIENESSDIESVSSAEFVTSIVKQILNPNTGQPVFPNKWVKYKVVHKKN